MLKELSKQYKVYCVDLLGLGLSSRPKFDCTSTEETIDFFVDSLEQWRIALGIEEFYLGGHSFGGYMACHYALKYQSRIKKLLLISPVGINKETDPRNIEQMLKELGFFRRQFYKLIMMAYEEKLTPGSFLEKHPWTFKLIFKIYVAQRFELPGEVKSLLYDYLIETFKLPVSSELGIYLIVQPPRVRARIPLDDLIVEKLSIPVMVYYGDTDRMDSSGAKKILKSQVKKDFDIKIVSGSSHQITLEQPIQLACYFINELIKV